MFCILIFLQIDAIIVISDSKSARNTSVITLSIFLLITSIILGSDLAAWWRIGGKSEDSEFLIANYIPFYISYYIVIIIECQYMHMINSLTRRLKLINGCLECDDTIEKSGVATIENRAFSVFRASPHDFATRDVMNLLTKHKNVAREFFIRNGT